MKNIIIIVMSVVILLLFGIIVLNPQTVLAFAQASQLVNWPMISAIAASSGVTIALIFYVINLRNTRLSNSAKMVFDLVKEFNSEQMRKQRGKFAGELLTFPTSIDLQRDAPVLEFFEEVAYMVKRGVLDKGMVWNSFSWVLEYYYLAIRDVANIDPVWKSSESDKERRDLIKIARDNQDNPSSSLFEEIEKLYEVSRKITKKAEPKNLKLNANNSNENTNDISIKKFLDDEAALGSVQASVLGEPASKLRQ